MLVFGRNISAHPDLNPNEPTSLETNVDVSEKIQSHLRAMSKAREAFIQAESDNTIAEALKARLVHRQEDLEIGQWIYWKDPVVKEWQGPHKIVFMDNKSVFIIRLSKLIPVNRDHIMLRRTETKNSEPLLSLPPLPVLKDEDSANSVHDNYVQPTEVQNNSGSSTSNSSDSNDNLELLEIVRKSHTPEVLTMPEEAPEALPLPEVAQQEEGAPHAVIPDVLPPAPQLEDLEPPPQIPEIELSLIHI